eukprot:TRINITY_DN3398_c0_g1_i5.p1 TRINITY_DN3398_c0_g1~~TRINITY_DN3398_c0_g1_i5.p1  ORF type:complete len:558 (+),score=96.82 TRINITY_DN3398_c0_g1_i5:119-1792(+)
MDSGFVEDLRVTVCYPNREPVQQDLPAVQTLEDLHAALGLESEQTVMAHHDRHREQQFMVEQVDQLQSGATLSVIVPRRRIFISMLPDIRKKAVMWYPGATVDQIEVAIVKAAGLPMGTVVELRDGEANIVLSESIPNETHLEVSVYVPDKAAPVVERPAERNRRTSPAQQSSTLSSSFGVNSSSAAEGRKNVSGKSHMQASASNRSVVSGGPMAGNSTMRRSSSPSITSSATPARGASPTRRSSASAVVGTTTPVAHQSAPEEHCVHILAGHTGLVFSICCVGDILFTGAQDNNIMIWDLNNLQYIGTLPGHRGFVKCLHASYQKKLLCSGSQDRSIRLWSLDSFSTVKTLYGHTGGVNAVLILDGGDVLVSGGEDRSLRVWNLTTYDEVATIDQAHLGGIFALACFGVPAQVISGARDRSLKVWDTTTWRPARTLHPPHYDGVTSIAVANKHGKFYSGSRDRSIKEWDVSALTNSMHTLHVHGDWVQALCMSASDDVLFSGSRDSTVKVWNGELQCQDVLQGHRGPVSALCAVGNRLFSASHDRTVRVWRIEQYG